MDKPSRYSEETLIDRGVLKIIDNAVKNGNPLNKKQVARLVSYESKNSWRTEYDLIDYGIEHRDENDKPEPYIEVRNYGNMKQLFLTSEGKRLLKSE